jgi:serine/threonine-protein kinase
MNSSDLFTERVLVQRYQLLEIVGTGAMGKVYRAKDKTFRQGNVAVKILARALDDMKMIERFQQEATISALLSELCPHIVKVTDYGVDENKVPFYVMELLNGENLADLIEFHTISLSKFFRLTHQICLAMETAHNGIFFQGKICPIIHRDLKPTNIFVIENDLEEEEVKVLDFGIAKITEQDKDDTEAFVGTPRYASPEQLQGHELDNRADIYSFGVVMYEMLTKTLPWKTERNSVGEWYTAHVEIPPNEFPPELNIPEELSHLVMKCLSKSPAQRPQSVGEIRQTLDLLARNISKSDSLGNKSGSYDLSGDKLEQKKLDVKTFLSKVHWPENRPQQKIVFPRILSYEEQKIVTIHTMLEKEEIDQRKDNIHYNQFVFQSYPHPMILWITLLYSFEYGPRWLPCYLDLQNKMGQQIASLLSESKKYYILLFSLDQSSQCQDLLSCKVMLKQRTNLKQWVSVGRTLNIQDSRQSTLSKKKLQQDFEEMKPKIILNLEKAQTMEVHG